LQKRVDDLLAAQKKLDEDLRKKADVPLAKEGAK
jgi:hypothetical protein